MSVKGRARSWVPRSRCQADDGAVQKDSHQFAVGSLNVNVMLSSFYISHGHNAYSWIKLNTICGISLRDYFSQP